VDRLSSKSDLRRVDAAAALAAVLNAEEARVWSFSTATKEVPFRSGMAMVDAIIGSQSHGGTEVAASISTVNGQWKYDRIIVITDEQSRSMNPPVPLKGTKAYMINVGVSQNGISYGNGWTHLDGFSENVLRFIHELENARG
jgi:60 kDa SS-A/Ro ribonucleoprotein